MTDYPQPVAKLLDLGEGLFDDEKEFDYVAGLGLTQEHIPDLIRMACDPELYEENEGSSIWAPSHARLALGQLGAVEAVAPLLKAMEDFGEYDDFLFEQLPTIFAKIGPAAIPAVASVLQDSSRKEFDRVACTEALEKIGIAQPEARDECVAVLTRQMLVREFPGEVPYALNGFIVSALGKLKAVESATVIEEAFAADIVDESIGGDWPYIQFKLGLGPEPPPRRYDHFARYPGANPSSLLPLLSLGSPQPKRPDLKKVQKKRKAEKKARKQSRKRK